MHEKLTVYRTIDKIPEMARLLDDHGISVVAAKASIILRPPVTIEIGLPAILAEGILKR